MTQDCARRAGPAHARRSKGTAGDSAAIRAKVRGNRIYTCSLAWRFLLYRRDGVPRDYPGTQKYFRCCRNSGACRGLQKRRSLTPAGRLPREMTAAWHEPGRARHGESGSEGEGPRPAWERTRRAGMPRTTCGKCGRPASPLAAAPLTVARPPDASFPALRDSLPGLSRSATKLAAPAPPPFKSSRPVLRSPSGSPELARRPKDSCWTSFSLGISNQCPTKSCCGRDRLLLDESPSKCWRGTYACTTAVNVSNSNRPYRTKVTLDPRRLQWMQLSSAA